MAVGLARSAALRSPQGGAPRAKRRAGPTRGAVSPTAALALVRLRIKEPSLVRPYRAWGFPWTPLIFLLAAVALTVNLWMDQQVRSSLGLLVILGGIPFFYRWRKPQPANEQSRN